VHFHLSGITSGTGNAIDFPLNVGIMCHSNERSAAMKSPHPTLPIFLLVFFLGLASPGLAAEPASDSEPAPKPRAAPAEEKHWGPPLVENVKELKQLGKYPAWLDAKNKKIVLVGEVSKPDIGLEFLVTARSRGAYESVLVVDANLPEEGKPSLFQNIQVALILFGAKPGHPSYYSQKDDKTIVATGDEIMIEVRWKNKEGKIEKTDARNWIRNIKTKKSPEKTWVFAGSGFVDDGKGGKIFKADAGDFICVLNNPSALLDLPLLSASALDDRLWEPNQEKLPPAGTPVTIVMSPKVKPKVDGGKK
jgi:hypothetical protein